MTTRKASGSRPVDGRVRKWHFRVFVSSTSWPRHYGLHVGEDRFGGEGEHYGYPWTRIGLFALCGHRCWFVGWELEVDGVKGENREKSESSSGRAWAHG